MGAAGRRCAARAFDGSSVRAGSVILVVSELSVAEEQKLSCSQQWAEQVSIADKHTTRCKLTITTDKAPTCKPDPA